MQEKNTNLVNFKSLREQSGMTLSQLSELSGYSIASINGLELNELNKNHINKLLELGKNICDESVNHKEILFNAINGFIKKRFEDSSEIDNDKKSLFLDFIKKMFMEKFKKQFNVNNEFYIFLIV